MRKRFSSWICLLVLCLVQVNPANAADPAIISRAAWKASAASFAGVPQVPKRIMIHHTGTKAHPERSTVSKMRNLQHFSQSKAKLADGRMKPAWSDVPYHFYIAANGEIAEGRAIDVAGDTNTAYNASGYIQIVVEGNFETEEPTDRQIASLKALAKSMMRKYGIGTKDIFYHRGVAQTACPGEKLIARLPALIAGLQ